MGRRADVRSEAPPRGIAENLSELDRQDIFGLQILSISLLALQRPETFGPTYWLLVAITVPVVLPCTLLGVKLYRQMSDVNFRRVTFILLGISGVGVLIKAADTFPAVSLLMPTGPREPAWGSAAVTVGASITFLKATRNLAMSSGEPTEIRTALGQTGQMRPM